MHMYNARNVAVVRQILNRFSLLEIAIQPYSTLYIIGYYGLRVKLCFYTIHKKWHVVNFTPG